MASWPKRVDAIREQPAHVRFAELEALVFHLGYRLDRQRGSHRIYQRHGLPTINLQRAKGSNAKPYQVRQVLAIIEEHGIEV